MVWLSSAVSVKDINSPFTSTLTHTHIKFNNTLYWLCASLGHATEIAGKVRLYSLREKKMTSQHVFDTTIRLKVQTINNLYTFLRLECYQQLLWYFHGYVWQQTLQWSWPRDGPGWWVCTNRLCKRESHQVH